MERRYEPIKQRCYVCESDFENLDIHFLTFHPLNECYECDICREYFSDFYDLKTHIMDVHEGQKAHKCNHCEKSFTTVDALKIHIKKSFIRKHKCDNCKNVSQFVQSATSN